MTGYQKLKKENQELKIQIKGLLYALAGHYYNPEDPKFKEYVNKEYAYIEKQIKDELMDGH